MRFWKAALLAASLAALPLAASSAQFTGSQVTEACHVWNGARQMTAASGYIGAAGWIMFFDASAVPSDGTVTPFLTLDATAAGTWSMFTDPTGTTFQNGGLVICASSTGPFTKTAYSTATFSAQVQ